MIHGLLYIHQAPLKTNWRIFFQQGVVIQELWSNFPWCICKCLCFGAQHFNQWSVLSTVLNQKPPLLEPKPAKTRPKNFYQKNHHNFRPNRHNFRNFEVEKLNFLQIPLMFTEKCENLAFFYPPPKIFPATQMSQTATFPPTRHNWQHWFSFSRL